jgi:hypothetical protein
VTLTELHLRELAEIKALAGDLHGSTQEVQRRVLELRDGLSAPGRSRGKPASDRNGGGPLLAFVHIPKTAGGTVVSMFAAAYTGAEVRDAGNYPKNPGTTTRKISRLQKQGGRVSAGHVPYGVFRAHLPPDTRYMTFLREPVERVLSHYYRHIHRRRPKVQRSPKREQHRLETPGKVRPDLRTDSIEEALIERNLPELNNLCTRFLSGDPSPRMTGVLPASALDDAKGNLREFAFIGIQDRFEESLVLLQRMLGLGSVPYRDRHVSLNRPAANEISDDERALITEHNQLDAELFSFGLELFEEAVAGADQGFAADVEALRARNAESREADWREVRARSG